VPARPHSKVSCLRNYLSLRQLVSVQSKAKIHQDLTKLKGKRYRQEKFWWKQRNKILLKPDRVSSKHPEVKWWQPRRRTTRVALAKRSQKTVLLLAKEQRSVTRFRARSFSATRKGTPRGSVSRVTDTLKPANRVHLRSSLDPQWKAWKTLKTI
jgi:hypothetical protein